MIHELKTHPEYFQKIWNREKLFEVRKDDRDFKVGDTLLLLEYDPFSRNFSTLQIKAEISYKLNGGQLGIENGFCILSLKNLSNWKFDPYFQTPELVESPQLV